MRWNFLLEKMKMNIVAHINIPCEEKRKDHFLQLFYLSL